MVHFLPTNPFIHNVFFPSLFGVVGLHPLEVFLVFTDLVDMALVLAFPGQIKVVEATLVESETPQKEELAAHLVEWDQQIHTVVPKVDGNAGLLHLLHPPLVRAAARKKK